MFKPPKHILVIRLSAMGDVAMTVPVLRAFIEQYPEVKITVLTKAFFAPFFRDLVNVEVFPADIKGKHKGIIGLYKLSKELRSLKFDVVADLHNVLRSKILKAFLTGKPFVQIDKGRKEKKALTSGKVFYQLKTSHERYTDVFRKLGFQLELSNPTFPEKVVLNDKTKSLLKTSMQRVGIAPFAAHKSKMYPLDLMEEVIEVLSKDYQVFLFGGGKQESLKLSKLEKKYDNVINTTDELTSMNEELDVISNLDVMLSMDSGNGHLAAMLGVKVISIWGVTHPYAGFTPFNQPETHSFLADRKMFPKIPTSIYGNKYPEGYENAAASIKPSEIIQKVLEII